MKKLALIIAISAITSAQACVNYNPSKGTYTVDAQGCVDKDRKYVGNHHESGASRDRSKESHKEKKDRKKG